MARTSDRAVLSPNEAAEGRLVAGPVRPVGSAPVGLQRLGLSTGRDGLLYVPQSYSAESPSPLALMLHGAGGDARGALQPFLTRADQFGMVLLAPDSRQSTWDVLRGGFGPDVTFINRALDETFTQYAIDPHHVLIEGFSDGASYALSLGLTNGDFFGGIAAFSPGFMAPSQARGKPRVFISHGTGDRTLAIETTSREIVPQLRRAGYDVRYVEFQGPHTVPPAIALQALEWLL
ncbi:MAG: alpha/beta hydrolase [Chloroflexota bacterium]